MLCMTALKAGLPVTVRQLFWFIAVAASEIKGLAPTVIRIWLCFGQRSRFSPVFSVTFTFASLCQRS